MAAMGATTAVLLLCVLFAGMAAAVVNIPLNVDTPHVTRYSRSTTNSPLNGCPSRDFYVAVKIGTQTFSLVVDSGSSNMAVASGSCCGTNVTPVYTPGGTATKTAYKADSSYGDQTGWNGTIYTDQVSLAGLTTATMNFVAMDGASTNPPFFKTSCSNAYPSSIQGIVGMGYPALLQPHADALPDVSAASWGSKTFSMLMCASTGTLTLGGYDATLVYSKIVYSPVLFQAWYTIGFSNIALSGTSLALTSSDLPGYTIADSGSTQLVLPPGAFTKLINALDANSNFKTIFGGKDFYANGAYCVNSLSSPTALNGQLPRLQLVVNGVILDMPAVNSYVYYYKMQNVEYVYCQGLGQSAPNSAVGTILGWSVLNNYYVVYDRVNNQVGFAETVGCGGSTPIAYTTNTTVVYPTPTASAKPHAAAWHLRPSAHILLLLLAAALVLAL